MVKIKVTCGKTTVETSHYESKYATVISVMEAIAKQVKELETARIKQEQEQWKH